MPYSANDYEYGPVCVLRGSHKGRIGVLDDLTVERGRTYGIVYFALFGVSRTYSLIPIGALRQINTNDLLTRHESVWRTLTPYIKTELSDTERIDALQELALVSDQLNERMFQAQFKQEHSGAKVFLSHSSVDKAFVRGLAVDLSALGHQPWLDEWEILGGESIPTRIAEGLHEADFVVLVLSKASVQSKWVEQEWQAKHWNEISEHKVSLIPLLLSDCEIPTLLKPRKYVDFRSDYGDGLEALARSLKGARRKLRGDS